MSLVCNRYTYPLCIYEYKLELPFVRGFGRGSLGHFTLYPCVLVFLWYKNELWDLPSSSVVERSTHKAVAVSPILTSGIF